MVLSASFDPGWTVTVDGHPARTEMVAPALVAVTVPAGRHHVVFRYSGFGSYDRALGGVDRRRWWSWRGGRSVRPGSAGAPESIADRCP